MTRFSEGNENCYNMTRQVIPGEIDVCRSNMSLIIHYVIQVDVLDHQFKRIASRSKQKQTQVTLKGLKPSNDLEEIAESIIHHYDMLSDDMKPSLIRALSDLLGKENRPLSTNNRSTSIDDKMVRQCVTAPSMASRSESMPALANNMTKEQVDDLLHDALQKIHWGNEKECLETLSQLVEISQYDRNLTLIIQHEPLMNTLINGLKKFNATSLPACIKIMTIFEKMSYFQTFADSLSRFKIGSMTLGLLHAQVALTNVADQHLEKEKLSAYLKSQNQLLNLAVSLLFNLSEKPSAMRKMVNKDIVSVLTALLERKNAELLTLSLQFLRKIASVPVIWSDIPYDQIVPAVVNHIFRWGQASEDAGHKHIGVLREGIELLYTFSFHTETIDVFKSAGVFEGIATLVGYTELRPQLIRMFYKCSIAEGSDEAFRNKDLLNMLITASTTDCEEKVIALVVLMKLSLDRECALTISTSSLLTSENLKIMFVTATTSSSSATKKDGRILLKLIRNVAYNQPNLVSGFDQEIVNACKVNANNLDMLCDIIAVASRAKINSDRAKFFTNNDEFVQTIASILHNRNVQPQLHLECIMLVSSFVLYSAPAQKLGKFKIVDLVVNVFLWHQNEYDIQTQCLYTFYRFVCHTDSRTALISHPEIVDAIIQHSASKNPVLNGIANAVLDALVTFDKTYADKIKGPRFDAFNQEWLKEIKVYMSDIANQQASSPPNRQSNSPPNRQSSSPSSNSNNGN